MKKRQRIKTKVGLGLLLVAALVLAMLPTQARAQDDADSDGFYDQEEMSGIYLPPGLIFPNGLDYIPPCGPNPTPAERAECVDSATPDLFVILVRATGCPPGTEGQCAPLFDNDNDGINDSNFSADPAHPEYFDPLELVSKPQAEGGLGIIPHEITPTQADPDRSITPTQKAVRITEYLDPVGIILGYASQGTPNDLDDAIIYTERIKAHVNSVCAEATIACIDFNTNFSGQDLVNHYIRHTIAHEIGHMTKLAVEYNRRFGGYHYKSGSEVVMEQAVKYSSKKGTVKFYISKDFALPSQEGVALK